MRLLITLFMLAFAQLVFNMAQAAPHVPVNASQHKAEKKSARDDTRRKRRPAAKSSSKKTRPVAVEKKQKIKKTSAPPRSSRLEHSPRKKLTATAKRPTRRHAAGVATASNLSADDDGQTIKMSRSHRLRYQKARDTAMAKLMNQLGKRYQWGGSSPHTGFDCSGLVWYAYKDLVKFRIPRTANEMYHLHDAAPVKRESLEKGDLVFFRINGSGAADHVGVYLGNGKFIQSPRTGKDIQISALSEDYWQRHYLGARRMMTPKTIR